MVVLDSKVRTILQRAFEQIPELYALWVERWPGRGVELNLYAQVRNGVDPDTLTTMASQGFAHVVFRLAEVSSAPTLRWYGLVQAPRSVDKEPLGPTVERVGL